jgi:hypothetical protein
MAEMETGTEDIFDGRKTIFSTRRQLPTSPQRRQRRQWRPPLKRKAIGNIGCTVLLEEPAATVTE